MRKDLKIGMLAGAVVTVISVITISLWPGHRLSKRLGFKAPENIDAKANQTADEENLQKTNTPPPPPRPPQNSLDIRKEYQIINTPDRKVTISELYSSTQADAHSANTQNQNTTTKKSISANEDNSKNSMQTPPAPAANTNNITASISTPEITTHTVTSGETLSSISQKYYGNANKWQKIIDANPATLKNSDIIKPGMNLKIPLK